MLRDIGHALVDIHGQSEHISLLGSSQHLEFLDAYAHTLDLRHDFGARAAALHQMEREIRSLTRSEQELARQMELLNFQIEEIRRAELREGEEAALERELALLTSAEKLKAASYEIYRIIYGDDSAIASSSALDKARRGPAGDEADRGDRPLAAGAARLSRRGRARTGRAGARSPLLRR